MQIQNGRKVDDFQVLKNLNRFIRGGENSNENQDANQMMKFQQVQKKPLEYKQSQDQTQKKKYQKKQRTKKLRVSRIQKQNAIICDNIIQKFFQLKDQKFSACIQRMYRWNFDTTMGQFIINYYLYIKNDNRLRQYITMHLKQIIALLKQRLQDNLYDSFSTFNFTNGKQYQQLDLLKQQLKNKLKALSMMKVKGFRQDMPIRQVDIPILSNDQAKDLKYQLLNQLKAQNQKLQEVL